MFKTFEPLSVKNARDTGESKNLIDGLDLNKNIILLSKDKWYWQLLNSIHEPNWLFKYVLHDSHAKFSFFYYSITKFSFYWQLLNSIHEQNWLAALPRNIIFEINFTFLFFFSCETLKFIVSLNCIHEL